jgi:hypothetical protein
MQLLRFDSILLDERQLSVVGKVNKLRHEDGVLLPTKVDDHSQNCQPFFLPAHGPGLTWITPMKL